ncbi:MAG: DUF1015 domain-containing protein [Deltaproteobacteria bacterium]|nr:DUF1015 domain-containing protein [Deltaproteobacteria bacterium]
MALVAPFRGLIYNPEKISHLTDVITPPYDVISPKQQEAFYARSPYNMIQLDLGKILPGDTPTKNRYTRSAELLKAWQREKVLIRDPKPTFYLYKINYRLPGLGRRERIGLLALLGLEPFDQGMVRPHEKTFSGIKVDRLHLLDYCRAHFGPIFSFYSDPENEILDLLGSKAQPDPFIDYEDEDRIRHHIRRVTDPAALSKAQQLFKEKIVYIADGHHRYETGLNFREAMKQRFPDAPPTAPFNFTLMYLCRMQDPGLTILPTHRTLCRFAEEKTLGFEKKISEDFLVESFPFRPANKKKVKKEFLARFQETARQGQVFGVYSAQPPVFYLLTLKKTGLEGKCAEDLPSILRELDVMILSRLVFQKVLGIKPEELDRESLIEYRQDPAEAMELVDSGWCRLAFLLKPTLIEQVQEVAEAGLTMPRKSTFFYPKIPTGLVINVMKPNDSIRI